MLDDLLEALAALDVEEIREAYRDEELDLFELCDRTTPAGLMFRLLCVICEQWELSNRHTLDHDLCADGRDWSVSSIE